MRVEKIGLATLYLGDCREVLPSLADADACVTDPPYGLGFMGKSWDYDVPSVDAWRLVLAACKPGAHLLAFAGTRTQHRMAVNVEDAGFEIRDMIAWVYASGFPKSLDVSKAIDKALGVKSEVVGTRVAQDIRGGNFVGGPSRNKVIERTRATSECARLWEGWGTALKPALEPITVARKPLIGTVAENVLAHGTGAINVDACRVGTGADKGVWPITQRLRNGDAWSMRPVETDTTEGRWPANFIHDGSDEVLRLMPETQSGAKAPHHVRNKPLHKNAYKGGIRPPLPISWPASNGSAARFFYSAKASRSERDGGCEGLEAKAAPREAIGSPRLNDMRMSHEQARNPSRNDHPTVKPIALMRYLCRLVTQPCGLILDPYMGSGSTGVAAIQLGHPFIGIEVDSGYFDIACRRIEEAQRQGDMFRDAVA